MTTRLAAFFARMRELLAKADAQHYDRAQMDILSMGMSHDYAAAIAEGATIVRVGTAIYGARDYSKRHNCRTKRDSDFAEGFMWFVFALLSAVFCGAHIHTG